MLTSDEKGTRFFAALEIGLCASLLMWCGAAIAILAFV